jgi:hypothetical protein
VDPAEVVAIQEAYCVRVRAVGVVFPDRAFARPAKRLPRYKMARQPGQVSRLSGAKPSRAKLYHIIKRYRAISQIMYCPGPLAERTMPLTRCSRSVTPTRFVMSAKSF